MKATQSEPDTRTLKMSVQSRSVTYGDGATFYEYRLMMREGGKVVGIEDGPRRTHPGRAEARNAGYLRIRQLKKHRLYIIEVTADDIENGEARSCRNCAIAQALYRNQERMGLPMYDYDFDVEPYGAFVDVDGIVLRNLRDHDAPDMATGESGMPDVVIQHDKGIYDQSMYEWASAWDEWADARGMTAKQWREDNDDEKPYKPPPCSFVLNLDEMKPVEQ